MRRTLAPALSLALVLVLAVAGGVSLFWRHPERAAAAPAPESPEPPLESAAPPDTNPLHL